MKFKTFDNAHDANEWLKMNKFSLKSHNFTVGRFAITVTYVEK